MTREELMIENFDIIKEQLRELASVINTFKSEAVQLRLIELVFQAAEGGSRDESGGSGGGTPDVGKPRKRKAQAKAAPGAKKEGAAAKSRGGRRPGGMATLTRLHEEGFFNRPKTIKQLVEHCDHNLALKYKQSDFSGALARLTREGQLKRTKNADKQYEYSQA